MTDRWTALELDNGDIEFLHDGSSFAPNYTVTVSDGNLSSASQAATIFFDAAPVLLRNQLIIENGETLVLSSQELQAEDDFTPANTLIFTIANLTQGQFEIIGRSGQPIVSFNQSQIINRQVRFVHDSSNQAPAYTVSVSDGELTTEPATATISFNQRPELMTNTLTIDDGGSIILTSSMLNTTDDQNPSALIYTVSNIQHGRFEFVSNPAIAIVQFTQQHVIDSKVRFVHDGSGQAPSYAVSVGDGVMSAPTTNAAIQFNLRPVLVTNRLLMKAEDTVINITASMLQATDDHVAGSLLFSVTNLQGGYFVKTSTLGVAITQFTQAEIDAGTIAFTRTSTTLLPRYTVSVSDGSLSTAPVLVEVAINRAPVIANNKLSLNQGDRVIITSSMLNIDDDATPSALTFQVSTVQHGRFELTTAPSVAVRQFTLQQVNDGQVCFVHDDSAFAPSYTVSVTDGVFTSAEESAAITFNRRPILTNNLLIVSQGQTVILTPAMLSVDDDSAADQIYFTVSEVTGGVFTFVGSPNIGIVTFTQQQINEGKVQFIQDGTDTSPHYKVSVNDGQITVPASLAVVQYSPTKKGEDLLPLVKFIASIAGAPLGALFLYMFYKNYYEWKARTQNRLAYDIYKRLNLELNYISPIPDAGVPGQYFRAMKDLRNKLNEKLDRPLYESEHYQYYIDLLAESIVFHLKPYRSELCGVKPGGFLATEELILDDLESVVMQQKIVSRVIQAANQRSRLTYPKGPCVSLKNFFWYTDKRLQFSLAPSIEEKDDKMEIEMPPLTNAPIPIEVEPVRQDELKRDSDEIKINQPVTGELNKLTETENQLTHLQVREIKEEGDNSSSEEEQERAPSPLRSPSILISRDSPLHPAQPPSRQQCNVRECDTCRIS